MNKPLPLCVFFDAGFTLIQPNPSVGTVYARVARDFGIALEAEVLDPAFGHTWRAARAKALRSVAVPYGCTEDEARAFWGGVVRGTFKFAGHPGPLPEALFTRLFDDFASAGAWSVYPDVAPALALLKRKGVRAAVLSNWDARLHTLLAQLGLADHFEAIVLSCEVGAEKPSPVIFDAARKRLGLRSDDAVALIGDESDTDGWGPKHAGWSHQCLVSRTGMEMPTGLHAAPDLVEAVRRVLAIDQ